VPCMNEQFEGHPTRTAASAAASAAVAMMMMMMRTMWMWTQENSRDINEATRRDVRINPNDGNRYVVAGSATYMNIVAVIIITRNAFCGTWYLP